MKSVLVTGGNRGIGQEICRQLAVQGHRVYLGSRDREKGGMAAEKMSGNVQVVEIDLADEAGWEQVVAKIDSLDALVNNAAVMPSSRSVALEDMATLRRTFDTNFFGLLRLTQLCLPLLRRSASPRIVNMSSGMGAHDDLRGGGYASYRLTKAAVNDLTILLAAENPSMHINAVCPGWVKTDMGGGGAMREVAQGADTPVWLVTAENVPTGKFLRDRAVIPW